jgi:hypothetical protein
MREERYCVQRPVCETSYMQQCRTVMRPVTTCRTDYCDQGCYVDQVACVPGRPTWPRLTWAPATTVVDPMTGIPQVQRGGLVWAAGYTPSQQVVQRVWRPNVVARQVPVVQYVPERVVENVPVQTTRMVTEQQVRQVPVQVCRMIQEEQVRKVPYQTCRQVVERVPRQVAVQVTRMVCEEQVRQVPVTTCRMVEEERVEPYQVRTCKWVCEKQTVQVPRVVTRQEAVVHTYRVPRTVMVRVPVTPCSGCEG